MRAEYTNIRKEMEVFKITVTTIILIVLIVLVAAAAVAGCMIDYKKGFA